MSGAAKSLSLPFVGGLSVGGSSVGGSSVRQALPAEHRVACVDVPELPLQMLLRRHPAWRAGPAAVIAEDRPEAPLLFVNDIGWKKGLRPGMRYGEARSLVSMLRAAPVLASEVDALVTELTHALQTFSPRVEPDERRRGVFYLDPKGLTRIYEDLQSWGEAISGYIKGRGFDCAVVVTHGRFASFALARSLLIGRWQSLNSFRKRQRVNEGQQNRPKTNRLKNSPQRTRITKAPVRVFETENEAQAFLDQVPLERLDLPPKLRDGLAQLTVTHLGDLRSMSAESLLARFGTEAGELRSLLTNDSKIALNPAGPCLPAKVACEIDPPDDDHSRLLFAIKGMLHELLQTVAGRGETLSALRIELHLEGVWRKPSEGIHRECITPARPTRDLMMLLDLVRLRLSETTLAAPIHAVELEAETEAVEGDQLVMFRNPTRDLDAGARALARVRATFGERSVTRARLKEAHLPEAQFSWEPTQTVLLPEVAAPSRMARPLIRRLFRHPKSLRAPPPSLVGPYRISGGWWVREVERDYYYAETEEGALLWLFYDRARHRWFVHGTVD